MGGKIMLQGTMSSVGKSVLTAALCRIFAQDGFSVAPFKSQNMALNSAVTADGLELGRAQALQAQACFKQPDVRMNPILLKPNSETGSQLIVDGEVHGSYSAVEYYRLKKELVPTVLSDFRSLSSENDIVVIEGAGSPAEINLRENDIVNMGLAELVNAPVLLVGDIDRGGVFAQLYGTVMLLSESEKRRLEGLIINKFRGDVSLLKSGLDELERLCGKSVLGVVPYSKADLDDEDSLTPILTTDKHDKAIDCAVIRLPKISNFTDVSPLVRSGIGVRFVSSVDQLGTPDIIIIPGTKCTMADMLFLRESGLEREIKRLSESTIVVGICGGYQMLGKRLSDPQSTELGGEIDGIGLLDIETVFNPQKRRTLVRGTVENGILKGSNVSGYELHTGVTTSREAPLIMLENGTDGAVNGNVIGTYMHGIFDSGEAAQALAQHVAKTKGITLESGTQITHFDYLDHQLNIIADEVRSSLDMARIYDIIERYKD